MRYLVGIAAASMALACDPSTPSSDAGAPIDASPARDAGSDASIHDAGNDASSDAGSDGGALDAGSDAGSDAGPDAWTRPVYCGNPADCASGQICGAAGLCAPGPCSASNACIFGYACQPDGTCRSATSGACLSGADCAIGSVCVAGVDGRGGVCTSASDQCIDGSQCAAGERCADGSCVLSCTSNADCRDGLGCNTSLGLCTQRLTSCTLTDDCASATRVCVEGACVPRSAGATCATPGDVWRANGCVPDEAPHFVCTSEGVQGSCASGSICLHHSCWISCDAPMQNVCASQPVLNTCKPLHDGGSAYDVCATAQNLGAQCGAGAGGALCAGTAVCVDGFCRTP